jgi:succinate dehydrogenase/fumarate reductase flavoprotein subunit
MKLFSITDLLTVDDTVVGVVGFDVHNGDFITVNAKAVVIATGGAANCWARNNGVYRSTGDGHAIAYRNGLEMHMMEYESFDPWIIAEKGLPQFWIPPSYGRTMATVLNANGEEFLHNYIELGPGATLKPGDPFHIKYGTPVIDNVAAIARAFAMEVYQGRGDEGAVLVDFSKVPGEAWLAEGKGIAFLHLMRDFNYEKKPVHMSPGALGSYGGIKISEEGETNLGGLFAGGEVSYGEDLKYTNVFGARAGRAAASYAMDASLMEADPIQVGEKKDYLEKFLSRPESTDGNSKVLRKEIQDLSMDKFGVLKTEEGLKEGLARLDELKKVAGEKLYATDPRELRLAFEVDNMLVSQEMHAKAALARTETRGPHNRLDYPYMDNDLWIKEILIKKTNGEMNLCTGPVRRGYVRVPKGRIPLKGMPQPE